MIKLNLYISELIPKDTVIMHPNKCEQFDKLINNHIDEKIVKMFKVDLDTSGVMPLEKVEKEYHGPTCKDCIYSTKIGVRMGQTLNCVRHGKIISAGYSCKRLEERE